MSVKKAILITVIIGILAYGSYAGIKYVKKQKDLLQDYEVALTGIRFTNIAQGLLTGQISMRIRNKSNVEATVQEVYTDVWLNDQYMGNIKSSKAFVVPAKGTNDITVDFQFAGKELLKDIIKGILTYLTTKDIPYRLEGYAKITSSFLTVSVPFKYSGQVKEDALA